MTVQELIEQLSKFKEKDRELFVTVWGCSGAEDVVSIDDLEELNDRKYPVSRLNINLGCDTHRKKWLCTTEIEKRQDSAAKVWEDFIN